MRRSILIVAFLFGLACSACADSLSLTYTVMGSGGQSQPIAGFSDSSFWWVDSTGTTPGSVLTGYGFDPVPPGPGQSPFFINQYASGSLLLSSSFTLTGTETLAVDFSSLWKNNQPWYEAEFALLLQNSHVVAVLADVRPDGINHTGDFGSMPGTAYATPSPGVTTSTTRANTTVVTLGGISYGQNSNQLGECVANGGACMTLIASSITPGAGDYQLLFGAFNLGSPSGPSALALNLVSVPEEGTLADLLVMAALALAWIMWRRLASRMRVAKPS